MLRSFNATQKKNFRISLLIMLVVFLLFIIPNAAASQNIAMVEVFSADEASPLPYVFQMIKPGLPLVQTLKNFIFYSYYPYGFVYFAFSALVVLPLQWFGALENTTLVMLLLRQLVSVLPMLLALLILVYLQDEFRTYRSIVLFVFLACIPAVVQNNLWWHPDGLVTFFMALALFFLYRDRLRFGKNYYFAAVACGLAIATKLVGLYFFLAVGLTLILGLIQKKVTFMQALKDGIFFILLMSFTYFAASPFWLSHWERAEFLQTMRQQSSAISSGYGIVYAKGILASWPLVHEYFGELIFLLLCLGLSIWGALKGQKRLLYGLILAWLLPLSVMVFYFSHFKFQYWMPAVLPVLSSALLALPEKWKFSRKMPTVSWFQLGAVLILLVQFGLFLKSDLPNLVSSTRRAENNPSIQFHDEVVRVLEPVETLPLHVYFDPSVYLPPHPHWTSTTTFDLLSYNYINENQFDVLLIMQQRIRDYLNPNAVGIDPAEFALSQQFYRDARDGSVRGYHLVFANDFGKVFVADDLYVLFPH